MKTFAAAGSAMLLAFAGMLGADDKESNELDGTYSVASMVKGGKAASKDLIQKMKLRIKGNSLTITIDGQEKRTQIKLDASKQPHAIDITPNEGPEKGNTFLGIYKMQKGELTLAYTQSGDRPKEFTGENDVIVMKLKKDEEK